MPVSKDYCCHGYEPLYWLLLVATGKYFTTAWLVTAAQSLPAVPETHAIVPQRHAASDRYGGRRRSKQGHYLPAGVGTPEQRRGWWGGWRRSSGSRRWQGGGGATLAVGRALGSQVPMAPDSPPALATLPCIDRCIGRVQLS